MKKVIEVFFLALIILSCSHKELGNDSVQATIKFDVKIINKITKNLIKIDSSNIIEKTLSPAEIGIRADSIYVSLCKKFPENRKFFTKNFDQFLNELDSLNSIHAK